MRAIVNYLRSMFCDHCFQYEETWKTEQDYTGETLKRGTRVSRTCSKCGWHKTYWKFQ